MPQECRGCEGTGKSPPIVHEDGTVTPAADCIQCDGAGNQETIEDINARVAQDEQWREGIETGEPMDIAWRLLKNDDKLARYDDDSDQYDEEADMAMMRQWAEDTKQLLPTLSIDDIIDEEGNFKPATNSPYPPGHWSHKHGDWDDALMAADEERYDLLRPYKDEAQRRRKAIYEAEAREKAEREEKERMRQVQEKTRADKMRAMAPQITEITRRFQDAFKGQGKWLDVSDKPIPRSVINSVMEEERGHARIDEFPPAWKEAVARIEEFQGIDEDIETGEPIDISMRLLKEMFHGTHASSQNLMEQGIQPPAEAPATAMTWFRPRKNPNKHWTHNRGQPAGVNLRLFSNWWDKHHAVKPEENTQEYHDKLQAEANRVWLERSKANANEYARPGRDIGNRSFSTITPQVATVDETGLPMEDFGGTRGMAVQGAIPAANIQSLTPYKEDPNALYTGEPMDLAWRLLKMPLMYDSIEEISPDQYTATFQDRDDPNITQQMTALRDAHGIGYQGMNVKVGGGDTGEPLIATGSFSDPKGYPEQGGYWKPADVFVQEGNRRRGIGGAMYDLINEIARRRGDKGLMSHERNSSDAQGLWRGRKTWPKEGRYE